MKAIKLALDKQKDQKRNDFFKEFLAGGFGGICFVLTFHPYDTIKVKMQTMPCIKGQAPLFAGNISCLKHTIRTEGCRGLYKGMLSPLIGVSPMFAFCFLGYDIGNKLQTPSKPNNEYSYPQIFISGMTAGLLSGLVLGPTERIKCLVQAQSFNVNTSLSGGLIPDANATKYSGTIDCLKKVYKEGGIRSVFKGTLVTLYRDVPSTGFYFVTYELLKKEMNLTPNEKELDMYKVMKILFAGGMAGVVNWVIAYPADVAKSKYQIAGKDAYKNILEVYKEIVNVNGYGAFYKGFGMFVIGAFVADAACFLGYEVAKAHI